SPGVGATSKDESGHIRRISKKHACLQDAVFRAERRLGVPVVGKSSPLRRENSRALQAAELVVERLAVDAEEPRRQRLVAAGLLERALDETEFRFRERNGLGGPA